MATETERAAEAEGYEAALHFDRHATPRCAPKGAATAREWRRALAAMRRYEDAVHAPPCARDPVEAAYARGFDRGAASLGYTDPNAEARDADARD
jgi:hypothetical protein